MALTHRDYFAPNHTHEFLELNLITAGQGCHEVSGAKMAVRANDVFVIPSGIVHAYGGGQGLDVLHVLLRPSFVLEHQTDFMGLPGFDLLFTVEPAFRAKVGLRYSLHLAPEDMAQAEQLSASIEAEQARAPSQHRDMVLTGLGLSLIACLCRSYLRQHAEMLEASAPTDVRAAAIHDTVQFMSEHVGQPLSSGDLATRARMSPSAYSRLFHQIIGVTPTEYLTRLRVERARRLLSGTQMPLTAVAVETGFYDAAHFTRTFRRIVLCTPGQYRKRFGSREV
jgi:AraC-like DNA-binding protein